MPEHEATAHHLAAIMFTDIVGYTAAMAESEARGMRLRRAHRKVVKTQVKRYGGEWIEETGDETLSSFPERYRRGELCAGDPGVARGMTPS